MSRRTTSILLAVLGAGVFLSGLELMITAVALPSIVNDLADWTRLRHASWIVNGYLLVYVATMPLAGRLADQWGVRRLFLAALAMFTLGSLLAGAAQDLDQLIAARMVQALGGGAIVPVATASASHLFEGAARPRALGLIGGLTFLGMAAGPFAGAAILDAVRPEATVLRLGLAGSPVEAVIAPAWRWVFYVNVPVGLVGLAFAWAATAGWETARRAGRLDVLGAVLFTAAVGGGLLALTLLGSSDTILGVDPPTVSATLLAAAAVVGLLTIAHGLRRPDPFLDPRLFRDGTFSSAALVSLLTGYGLATAIVGGAVFVDRVLYGGPADQRLALGALAAATALGALVSGFAVRLMSLRAVTLAGLAAAIVALVVMSTWRPGEPIERVALGMAAFGVGFGLTVTPRSTAAVEAVGRRAFGVASATVTVARMVGMAIGLAILTAYGSTTIDRLTTELFATPDAYRAVLPPELRDRPLRDGLVVEALEAWAAGKAAEVMVGLFLGAAGLMVVAIPPALVLGGRHRTRTGHAAAPAASGPTGSGTDEPEPTLAL